MNSLTVGLCSYKMCTSGHLGVQTPRQAKVMTREDQRAFHWRAWTTGWLYRAAIAVMIGVFLVTCIGWLVKE